MPREQRKVEDVVQRVLGLSTADETEVVYNGGETALTRFSENQIHQNVTEADAGIIVRVALGSKIGIASTNVLDDEGLKECVDKATNIAEASQDDDEYPGMPKPGNIKKNGSFDKATAGFGPGERALAVGDIIGISKKAKMKAAGSFMVGTQIMVVGNSHGVYAEDEFTKAEMTLVTSTDDSSGYAGGGGWRVSDIDATALTEDAVRRAEMSHNARDFKPGKYDVVLEGYCISDITNWLSFVVFNTKAVLEGRSLLAERMGDKIMGDNITMTENAYHPAIGGLPFDFEGVPRQEVTLVDKGVAKNLLYDSVTAKMADKPNTGHGLPSTFTEGPIPLYTVWDNGDSDVDTMIKSLDRGLYVTRFHYINGFVEPMKAVFTGMTRDGTFWVEDGEIKYPVKNLRWTQSMLEAFSNVKMISKDVKVSGTPDGMMTVAPAMYISDFNITGATE
jgi:predicted Zn-dependent protease